MYVPNRKMLVTKEMFSKVGKSDKNTIDQNIKKWYSKTIKENKKL